jgi:hypothetical protein
VHNDSRLRLLDDVQNHILFLSGPWLILRLLAAVYLRVTESVRKEEVVLQTIVIIVDHILPEVTAGVVHGAQGLTYVVQGNDIRRQDIGATPELSPALLVPDLAVTTLPFQVFVRSRQEPGEAAALARRGREKGHPILVSLGVLEVIDTGQFMHHAGEGWMDGDILDLFTIEPDVAAVSETLEIALPSHGP